MKNDIDKHTDTSFSKRVAELSNFTLELQKKIEQANILDDSTGHKFAFKSKLFNLLLPAYQPAEIISPPQICTVPHTPDWFRGMINLRGNIVPVFDIDILVSGNYSESFNWLMVFGRDESMASICIDTLPSNMVFENRVEISGQEIPEILYAHINNAYREKDILWIEPNYASLLAEFSRHF